MAEELSGKPQLGNRMMKAVWPFIASNGVPYYQMMSVVSHSTSGREGKKEWTEGKNDRMGRTVISMMILTYKNEIIL